MPFGWDSTYYAVVNIEEIKLEVKRLVGELREKKVPEREIYGLFVRKEKLSRLLITKDNRLILQDFGVEIHLKPLPKAVYLLFLCHPEGINFKDLPDYTDELREIYRGMKLKTEAPRKVEQSIIDVTNPLNHSIIEKCTTIRREFKKAVGLAAAKHYVIVGKRGETKRIVLDRKLVVWEKENPPLDL